eukprot:tig00020554_g10903.t1
MAGLSMSQQRRTELKGKRIVIVGAGYIGKKVIFDKAIELGVNIVLVDPPGSWAAPLVEHYLVVDTLDRDNAAENAVKAIKALNVPIDGVVTFWENDTPLKYKTREAMEKAGLRVPAYMKVKNDVDLEEAVKKVPFPAVLKPVFGAEAQGATKVTNAEEAKKAYYAVKKLLSVDFDTIYSWGVEFILEQYLDGAEVDVDLLLFDGKVVFHSITDNLETNEPDFLNTASILPSILPAKMQEELVDLAARASVDAIGLKIGAVHVEMKYTSTGPQIVEVNARMCGNPYFDWIKAVWGVCFIEESFMAVCGIPIKPFKPELPLCYLAGCFLLTSKNGEMTQEVVDKLKALEKDKRCFEVKLEVDPGHKAVGPPDGREELGWITVKGNSVQQAARYLRELTGPGAPAIPDFISCKQVSLPPHLREDGAPEEPEPLKAPVPSGLVGSWKPAQLAGSLGQAALVGSLGAAAKSIIATSLSKSQSQKSPLAQVAAQESHLSRSPRVVTYMDYGNAPTKK